MGEVSSNVEERRLGQTEESTEENRSEQRVRERSRVEQSID